jgi:methylmalonyl-CoA/ethylmalonyl-CoA epimerase
MMAQMTIGQIELAVRDVDRAVEFYRDKAGLPLIFASPAMALFDCGGVRLALRLADGDRAPANSTLYFRVNDIDTAAAELEHRGVAFEREPHLVAHLPSHDLWMAFFRDPEGNKAGLMCERLQ